MQKYVRRAASDNKIFLSNAQLKRAQAHRFTNDRYAAQQEIKVEFPPDPFNFFEEEKKIGYKVNGPRIRVAGPQTMGYNKSRNVVDGLVDSMEAERYQLTDQPYGSNIKLILVVLAVVAIVWYLKPARVIETEPST